MVPSPTQEATQSIEDLPGNWKSGLIIGVKSAPTNSKSPKSVKKKVIKILQIKTL